MLIVSKQIICIFCIPHTRHGKLAWFKGVSMFKQMFMYGNLAYRLSYIHENNMIIDQSNYQYFLLLGQAALGASWY